MSPPKGVETDTEGEKLMKSRKETRLQPMAGFTLIELLIVVAIIAILAAIAVPNFLEAQVRSKVSRVHSDFHTIAIAINAYAVDHGRPPIDANYGVTLGLWPSEGRDAVYQFFTTPIAYLTSAPVDVFLEKVGRREESRSPQKCYYYHCLMDPMGAVTANSADGYRLGYIWYVRSLGPDRVAKEPFFLDAVVSRNLANVYDPTNGTISAGDIWWSNKGLCTGDNL